MSDLGKAVSQPKGRIMVVDDEPNARNALVDLLVDEGYVVEAAANGFRALDRLAEFAPDLLVTDLKMPGMDGVQLIQRIRQRGNTELPVVVMSAIGELQPGNAIIRSGAQHYLPKPLDLTQLTAVVAEELERRRHPPDRIPGSPT